MLYAYIENYIEIYRNAHTVCILSVVMVFIKQLIPWVPDRQQDLNGSALISIYYSIMSFIHV
jgi:hypothetical protein